MDSLSASICVGEYTSSMSTRSIPAHLTTHTGEIGEMEERTLAEDRRDEVAEKGLYEKRRGKEQRRV